MIVSEILSKIREWIRTGIPKNVKSSNMRTLLTWIAIRMDVQEPGRLKVVKISGNTTTEQEVGDRVSGIIEDTPVVNAIYLGGNVSLLSSYFVPNILTSNPTENTFTDIADLLANQNIQTSGFNQRVVDASADPEVASGEAVYLFKGSNNGLLSDYIRLSDSDVGSVDLSSYQKRSEKGTANGYAGLDALQLLPIANHNIEGVVGASSVQTIPLNGNIFWFLNASGVLVRNTWLDLKATLKTYFDTIYLSKTAIRPRTRITYTGVSGTQNIDFALSIEFRIVMTGATTITFSNYDKALGETTGIYFSGAVPVWPATVNVVLGSEMPNASKRNYAVLNVFDAGSGTEVVDFSNKIMN